MLLGGSHTVRGLAAAAAAFCALLALPTPTDGQTPRKPETSYEAKVLCLYNFAMWTEWPKEAFSDPKAPFILGILGQDPFGKDIDVIKDRTVKGRRLEIRYFVTVQDATDCHLLYISSSEKKRIPEILKALEHSNVLTVAEMEGFTVQNGMVNLLVEKADFEKPRWQINQAAAERAKLRIDPHLLAAAQIPRKPETPYQIRACFLVNFALYTEWPKDAFADPHAPFVFGILGRDDFGKDIEIVRDNVLRGRKLVVKHYTSVKEVEGCHVLYISASEESRLAEIFQRLGDTSILTVGEMDGFLERGGMLNFVVKKTTRPGYGTLGYEVNPTIAEKARLRINSQLLARSGRD